MQIEQAAQEQIGKLKELVQAGLGSIQKAGEIVVSLVDQGYTLKLISSLSGMLTIRDVSDLQRIGERKMNPALMMLTNPAVNYLKDAPIEIQAEIIENGVEVAVLDEEGKVKKEMVPIQRMSHRMCKQAFSAGRVRSIAAQKKILIASAQKVKKTPVENWEIKDGVVQVNKPCQFTLADLRYFTRQLNYATK